MVIKLKTKIARTHKTSFVEVLEGQCQGCAKIGFHSPRYPGKQYCAVAQRDPASIDRVFADPASPHLERVEFYYCFLETGNSYVWDFSELDSMTSRSVIDPSMREGIVPSAVLLERTNVRID